MRKVLLILAAVVAAAPAWADWVLVAKNEDVTWSMDPRTLRVKGNIRRIWLLQNFPAESYGNDFYRSSKTFEEYDCGEDKHRTLQMTTYKDHDGSGSVVGPILDKPSNWKYNAPGTAGAFVANAICMLRTSGL